MLRGGDETKPNGSRSEYPIHVLRGRRERVEFSLAGAYAGGLPSMPTRVFVMHLPFYQL